MNESNISRDHIALEAMKIILDKSIKQRITPVQRIRKLAGLRYEVRSFFIHNPGNVAEAVRLQKGRGFRHYFSFRGSAGVLYGERVDARRSFSSRRSG